MLNVAREAMTNDLFRVKRHSTNGQPTQRRRTTRHAVRRRRNRLQRGIVGVGWWSAGAERPRTHRIANGLATGQYTLQAGAEAWCGVCTMVRIRILSPRTRAFCHCHSSISDRDSDIQFSRL